MVDFSDFASIISQVVVNDVRNFIIASIESEDFAIVVEELLLRGDSSTSEGLLHEFLHFAISEHRFLNLSLSVAVKGDSFSLGLWLPLKFEEFTSVLVAVTDTNLSS